MTQRTNAVVELDYPVTIDGREIISLGLRRMRAGDALVAEQETNQTRAGYALFARLAGVDVEVIEALDMEDIAKLSEAMVGMLGKRGKALMSEEMAKLKPSDGAT